MRDSIRLGVTALFRLGLIATVVLAAVASAWAAGGDDPPPATPDARQSAEPVRLPPDDTWAPGAASIEPEQSLEEDAKTESERAFIESVWTTP